MTRIKLSFAVATVTGLAFFATQSAAQAQFGYGFNNGYSNYPSYGATNYGTPYNYYLANRAFLTPNVYNNALPYRGNFGGGFRNFSFNQFRYNVSPFGGSNYRYRYGRYFGR